MTVRQANTAFNNSTAISATFSSSFPSTFEGEFFPNSVSGFEGQVFFNFSGTFQAAKSVSWTAFTYVLNQCNVNGLLSVFNSASVSGNGTFTGEIIKNGGSGNSCRIAGILPFQSPRVEFYSANTRRLFMGEASSGNATIKTENGASLIVDSATGISLRSNTTPVIDIASDLKTTFSQGELIHNNLIAGSFGQMRLVYGSYGAIFRQDGADLYILLTNSGNPYGTWNSLRPFRLNLGTGQLFLGTASQPVRIGDSGYGTIAFQNPNGSVSHWGYPSGGGSENYIRGTRTYVDTPLTLNNGAYIPNAQLLQCSQILNDSNAGRIYLSDVGGNITNFFVRNDGSSPVSFGPGNWELSGLQVFTTISNPSGNSPGLGIGGGPNSYTNRSCVVGLHPGIAWGELILSSGTVYTSCFGVINNYTNGGGWVFISDKRYKKDIKDIKTARSLERIMALKPKTYKKIYPDNPTTPVSQEARDADHIGFLAQDVQESNPHCVLEHLDDNCVCEDDDGKRLGIAYGDINIHMVGAIQELKKQNDLLVKQGQEAQRAYDAQQKEIDELKKLVSEQNKLLEMMMDKLAKAQPPPSVKTSRQ